MESNHEIEKIKNQKAVALRYRPDDPAPRVIAKGRGYVAGRIIETADSSGIPVHRDAGLAEELTKIEIGKYIPPELYEIVAQVLIFLGELDRLEGLRRGGSE